MLDTALLDGIAENWAHCLKKLVIDVRASYRNIRYQFFGRRTEALEWDKFNENCTKCGVQVRVSAKKSFDIQLWPYNCPLNWIDYNL